MSNKAQDELLRRVSKPISVNHGIRYKNLTFDANHFVLTDTESGPRRIALAKGAAYPPDQKTPFGGCPATRGGGVAYIAKIISDFVIDKQVYTPYFVETV